MSKNQDGKQMSNDWLTGSKTKRSRIFDAVQKDRRLAIQIQDDLDNNQVERVLSKVDSNGNLKTIRLDGGEQDWRMAIKKTEGGFL